MPRLRRLAVVVMLVVTGTAGMLVGLAPPAFAGTFPSTSLSWSASSTGTGVTGVGYTYFFTPASSSPVKTVTMTVPAGTAGTPAVGTVTPSTLTGDSVALAGTTLTFTSTAAPTLSSSTPVSIQITGLTNTSTSGSYTSTVTTNNASGTLVDSGTTPVPGVSITGARVPAPAGQWQFGEGSGTNAYDSSGNGHTGTVGSGATWAAPEVGKYSLATSGTLTAAVTIPGPVVNTAASYTVSAWVYLNNVNGWQSNYQTFVSITGLATPLSNTVDGFYLQYRGNTHDWGFDVYPSDSNTGNPTIVVAQSTAAALPNTWYHLVGVYNSVAQTLSLYVNGVLQGTPTSYTSSWQATGNTMIGQGYFSGTTNYVNGGTDDVALYSSALTTPQVDALNQPTISSGYSHTCEITNGNAYCWGLNASGELGDNSTVSSTVPVPVLTGGTSAIPTGTILTQISAGDNSTCALSSAGAAYCWGGDSSDQLGTNTSITGSLVPLAVSGGYVFTQIDEGNGTTCALTSAGAAYCWGANASGQLGPGGTCPCSNSNTPVLVSAPLSGAVTWAQISAGGTTGTNGGFVCAVTTTGLAYCWGGTTGPIPARLPLMTSWGTPPPTIRRPRRWR